MALDQVDVDQLEKSEVKEMTFFDHLEELRMHILRAMVGVVAAAILLCRLCFLSGDLRLFQLDRPG